MTDSMSHPETMHPLTEGDDLIMITDRLRIEAKAVHDAFADLAGEAPEEWRQDADRTEMLLAQMQEDLDRVRNRLLVEKARPPAVAHDDLDAALTELHGRYDELRLQLRLGQMAASDQLEQLRRQADHLIDRGRNAVHDAQAALRAAPRSS
jgi:ElaB/YqjD/DUF883 family membrane-anchored ribosome-binding protein